jgi:hypothetical protein
MTGTEKTEGFYVGVTDYGSHLKPRTVGRVVLTVFTARYAVSVSAVFSQVVVCCAQHISRSHVRLYPLHYIRSLFSDIGLSINTQTIYELEPIWRKAINLCNSLPLEVTSNTKLLDAETLPLNWH